MEGNAMTKHRPMPFEGSTSAPADASLNSGHGSIMAAIVSRGVAVTRHTPQGSMQPFGQDMGTASDNTILATDHVVSNFTSPAGTGSVVDSES
jgi:hypothetical protein